MVEQSVSSTERLYLARNFEDSRQDIYVDGCPLVQHQLNGIRYLYRVWKKKKPGVILNDPSGYGKRVQTALFLSAVLPTLTKPVLILCREGSEQLWMNYFQEWTKIFDDVCIEQSNPFTKKKVFITTTYAATAFAKREWSMLVVDHDLISKDVQKSTPKADMRVWITSSPLKENLAKFSTFYSWIYPKAKFTADKFKANQKDLNDILKKTAMLDSFLEDIVLRRDRGEAPFLKSQISNPRNILEEPKVTRITKRNKDATGTKIKRSKRKSEEIAIGNVLNKVARTTKIKNTTENNTEAFEIGNIDNEKTTVQIFKNIQEVDCNAQSDEEDFAPLSRKSKMSKSLWDSEGSEDEQLDKTNNPYDKENHTQSDESGEQLQVLRYSDTDSENGLEDNVNKGKHAINFSLKSKQESAQANEIINTDVDVKKLDNSGNLKNHENHIESLHYNDTNNEIMNEVSPIKYRQLSDDLFSTDLTTNNELKVKTIVYETESAEGKLPTSPNNLKVKKIVYDTESGEDNLHISPNNFKVSKIVSETEGVKDEILTRPNNVKEIENKLIEINNTSLIPNLYSFDIKMKELEERMLKKYKGSFLDMM